MKTLKLLTIYVLGLVSLFTIYLLSNIDSTHRTIAYPVQDKIHPTYNGNSLHSEWSFNISKHYNETKIHKWSEPKRAVNVSTRQGAGENGTAFVPSGEQVQLMRQIRKQENYNLLASDMMSLHRSLPDYRYDECKRLSYPEKLPDTSIVIIFHNEAWTTLLRTVWSIIERSPSELINEIILVDDASTSIDLKRPLDDYIEHIPIRIKLIRTTKREGLIRARLIGAKQASGDVLTFLDGHIECSEGWLEPLLARIASDRSVIVTPRMDFISIDDMSYVSGNNTPIHGFRWSLIFNWMPLPERERIRTHYDNTAPVRTPTMVGCSFSIDREFFFEIGSYDEGMDIWGSENMEMSLRVWQCGGSMEIIPCSHVGHLFRKSTYSFDGNRNFIKERNNVRLVEVWMDDLKHIYYAANPRSRKISAGDISQRIELKKQLKCKDFRWYLENVYPESNLRKEFVDFVQIRNIKEKKCIDTHPGFVRTPLTLFKCHGYRGNQLIFLTNDQMLITTQGFCVSVDKKTQHTVRQIACTYQDSNWWKYDNGTKWIIHIPSGQCMQASKQKVILGRCDASDASFKWDIKSTP